MSNNTISNFVHDTQLKNPIALYKKLGISVEDIELFEEVFRTKLIIADLHNIQLYKKMTVVRVDILYNYKTIIENNREYSITMLISCYGLNILLKKGYYITEKYFIKLDHRTKEIYLLNKKIKK